MIRRAVTAAVAVAVIASAPAVAAHATQYRYWTYWHGVDGDWTFASVGPASSVPADGDVEGWRFAVTEGVRGQGQEPRIPVATAFRQFCGGRDAPAGQKRVAVIFDFGEVADAPDGQTPPAPKGVCVVTSDNANGAAVLSQAATIRTDRGLVCAIGGYPEGECAPALTPTPSPREATETPAAKRSQEPARAPRSAAPPDAPAPASSAPQARAAEPTADDEPTAAPRVTKGARDAGPKRPTGPTTPPTPAASATPLPVFVEADAAVVEPPARSWAPLAAVAALLTAVGGFVWWRRRA